MSNILEANAVNNFNIFFNSNLHLLTFIVSTLTKLIYYSRISPLMWKVEII